MIEKIDYSEDLDFWRDASPCAAWDYLQRHEDKKRRVSDVEWRKLCDAVRREEGS